MTTARCPMCATAFDVPAEHAPLPTLPAPVTTQTIPPAPLPLDPLPLPAPPPRESDSLPALEIHRPPRPTGSRTAANWLKTASALGLAQLALCGCCDIFEAGWYSGGRPQDRVAAAIILLAVRLVVLVVMWSAADSLRRGQSFGYVRFAARAAVVLGLYMLWRSRVVFVVLIEARRVGGDLPAFYLIYGLFHAAVAVPALVGGVWALAVLGRSAEKSL